MELVTVSVCPSNTSSSGHPSETLSWNVREFINAVVLGLGFLLGFPGNIAVIIHKPNIQHLSPVTQSLMLSLAVSDLLCLLTIPFGMYALLVSWTLGPVTCKLLTYLSFVSIYVSLMTVTDSVQHYLVVVKQRNTLNLFGPKLLLVLLWPVSLILSIPALVVLKDDHDEHWVRCIFQFSSRTQKLAVLLTETLVGFASCFVVAFSYIQLYRKVNRAAFFNNPQTSRLVTSIIIVFFFLWIPYLTVNVLVMADPALHNGRLSESLAELHRIIKALLFINSCLNPLLYAFTSHICKC
uniref:Zgc:194202 n=1 Tax=Oryzias sinensis TaxID=183150 RepID=A0A8C7ZQW2_9TELE